MRAPTDGRAALYVGDRMQMAVQFIEWMKDEHTLIIRVKDIVVQDDGTKMLVLERADEGR